ncbi:MAG: ergothioneine biosynthesis protein EgtC [Pseudomonadota bacterium]
MCRLLAYLGPEISLGRLISEGEQSLVAQSYQPKEMTSGVVNADGFGFAWYDGSVQKAPLVYRNILPIWSDGNLPSLERYIRSGCLLANVRSATPGQGLDYGNTQPFVAGAVSVVHNGFVESFADGARRVLRDQLPDQALDLIRGNTDSEYLFAHLAHTIAQTKDLTEGVARALISTAKALPDRALTLNFIISDGRRIVATRHAVGTECPSLYTLANHPRYPDAVVVASEPLFEDRAWIACPEGSILTIDPRDHARAVTTDRVAA